MALASRILSRSRQIYATQAVFSRDNGAFSVRSYAKDASPPALKGDEMLKEIFLDVKKKYETVLSVFKREKITIDPDDSAAVTQYANVWKIARKEAGLLSDSERIQNTIQVHTRDIPDARTYLLKLQEIRIKNGLLDEIGAEKLMFEALEKVEKEIKKPLLRNDKKNMALLLAEFDKVNKKLGIKKEDLPKMEEELDLKVAKIELAEMKKDVVEAMETQLKREEFKDEKMPDVRTIDIRSFM
ncbi:ATP synthase [Rhynchospora pubera]|uniref:ATP synthase n=1 Tax=Rhynchospora pubera TaxID=906938 RepID=A0AAV8HDK4_9POAL|nr:ATP synthase [Rhynchospora pubera]